MASNYIKQLTNTLACNLLTRSAAYTLRLIRGNSGILLQDIINDEEIKLDWLFKASLTHDIVNVSNAIYYNTQISLP